jgi:hypothetical protein
MSKETNIWLHEGNIYEFGQDYLFSNNRVHWTYGALTDLDGGCERVFCTADKEWLYIKEVPASKNMGTITTAPIELINGNAYMFDYKGASYIGIYTSPPHRFIQVDGWTLATYCTNIRPMTVEKK